MFKLFFIISVVSATTLTLDQPALVDLRLQTPGTIEINGMKFRESSSTGINSQLTIQLQPGKYDFNANYKVISGIPLYTSSGLDNIQVQPNSERVIYQTGFYLESKTEIGYSYHLELSEKYGCINDHDKHLVKVNLKIDGNIVDSGENKNSQVVLERGFHDVSLTVSNDDDSFWGNFPSTGNGFQHGRYFTLWKTNGENEKILIVNKLPLPILSFLALGEISKSFASH